jgi:hypothetical protein
VLTGVSVTARVNDDPGKAALFLNSLTILHWIQRRIVEQNMSKYKVGDYLMVKLSGGRIVEATVKAIVAGQMVSVFKFHSGTKRR